MGVQSYLTKWNFISKKLWNIKQFGISRTGSTSRDNSWNEKKIASISSRFEVKLKEKILQILFLMCCVATKFAYIYTIILFNLGEQRLLEYSPPCFTSILENNCSLNASLRFICNTQQLINKHFFRYLRSSLFIQLHCHHSCCSLLVNRAIVALPEEVCRPHTACNRWMTPLFSVRSNSINQDKVRPSNNVSFTCK